MIERVYDENGHLVHDCVVIGCAVSWDGYVRDKQLVIPGETDAHGNKVPDTKLSQGDRVPGGDDPDTNWWDVGGGEAKRRKERKPAV